MAGKLVTHVMLREPGATTVSTFGPGDKLPDWALKQVEGKDHLFEKLDLAEQLRSVSQPPPAKRGGEKDYAEGIGPGREPAASEQGQSQLVPVDPDEGQTGGDENADGKPEQPKGNASREAWELFATHDDIGVPVTPEMGRDDIRDACIEAGVAE
ncbi:hypothetical protein SEA_ENNEA_36 [Gordonia phage Ennea]|uniref:Head-to-tail connector protein n=1 Tax=Gordonia Phage Lollipop1437 TaxID=2588505 RepID=A0A4Y6ETE7_9CAUD|nr:head-tail connector protein [Gordonia Phage Lollipop1437]QDF19139.1 hypothetical protein SEA_LOLLIPOP1437_35 [Gordonia Phage Lollipop1437]QRI45272.1 hypothetical protein SEA_ENNEA_36 [Gordonia phage Ennea]